MTDLLDTTMIDRTKHVIKVYKTWTLKYFLEKNIVFHDFLPRKFFIRGKYYRRHRYSAECLAYNPNAIHHPWRLLVAVKGYFYFVEVTSSLFLRFLEFKMISSKNSVDLTQLEPKCTEKATATSCFSVKIWEFSELPGGRQWPLKSNFKIKQITRFFVTPDRKTGERRFIGKQKWYHF